jgi:sec-independent protein translocase protein TatA
MPVGLFQPWHIVVILVLVVLVFGVGKIAETGGALGKSIRDFRHAVSDEPTSAGLAPVGRHCSQCGARLAEADRFCASCGAAVGAGTA